MAYWLYKKIRDRNRNSGEQHLLGSYPETSNRNEAPMGVEPSDKETSRRDPQLQEQPRDKQAQKEARLYRWRLIGGLFLPATVQALNTTLIAGALPFIASDFNEFAQINWIVTAYNLTAAAFIPIVSATRLLYGVSSPSHVLLPVGPTRKCIRAVHCITGIACFHDIRKCALRRSSSA